MPKLGFDPETAARMNAIFAGKSCCLCGAQASRFRKGYVRRLLRDEVPPAKRKKTEYYYCHDCFQGASEPLVFEERADTLPGCEHRRRA